MGLRIGDTVAAAAALRQPPPPPRQDAVRPDVAEGRQDQTPPRNRNRGEQEDTLQVGFGENTVSVPGVALSTVGRNLANARDAVPSVEELQDELRARQAEARARQQLEGVEGIARDDGDDDSEATPVRFRPESSPQVRGFQQEDAPPPPPANGFVPPGTSASDRLDILI